MTLEQLRERIRQKRDRKKRMVPPKIPPRYDERFWEITRLLSEEEAPHDRPEDMDVCSELGSAVVPGGNGMGGDLVGAGGVGRGAVVEETEG